MHKVSPGTEHSSQGCQKGEDTLSENYPDLLDIFGAMKYESWRTVYAREQPINWSYYEKNNYDWRFFNQTIFYGIKPTTLNHERMQEIIQFESPTNTFSLSENEIFMEHTVAIQNNFTIGDNITIGNYFYSMVSGL